VISDDLDLARTYIFRGWQVVPVPAGSKASTTLGWNTRSFDLQDLIAGNNIAVILGPRSGCLVDVDLDCSEALALADLYLPTTGAVFGRASKHRSHRLYIAPDATFEAFVDPSLDGKNTLVELRAQGRDGGAHQTLFPPSVADGERREWHGDVIAPAVINAREIARRVAWLAIGCLVLRHVSEHAARRPAPDLPNLLWETDHVLGRAAFGWLGQPAPDAPRRHPRPRRELSQADLDLAELVQAIPNNCGWEEWNAVGMAIFAADSSEHGLTVFDDFSAKSGKYDEHAVRERWRNYRRSPPNRTGIGKLIALALAAGWKPKDSAA
jgi:hypothetical protein